MHFRWASSRSISTHTCGVSVTVGVVRCDGFLLWRLPYLMGCNFAYCTAASGLVPTFSGGGGGGV